MNQGSVERGGRWVQPSSLMTPSVSPVLSGTHLTTSEGWKTELI